MLVACKVVVERLLGRNPRFLQLNDHERQAVHKADEVRADGVERPGHGHLAHQQEVVAHEWLLPVDDPQPFRLLSPVLTVRHRHRNAGLEEVVHLTVGGDEAHRGAVPRQRFNRERDRLGRGRRVQPFQRSPQPGHQHDLGGRLPSERAGWSHRLVRRRRRLPAQRCEELNRRLFDELVFGVGVWHLGLGSGVSERDLSREEARQ